MREQNIEKLFKDTFSNFEADVNPSAWANIEQGLPAAPQNIPGHSPVAKPAGFFGKIHVGTVLLVTAISAALIGTAIYFSSQKSNSPDTLVQAVKSESQAAQNPSNSGMNSQAAPVLSEKTTQAVPLNNAPVTESNNATEKQATTKGNEKAQLINPAKQPAPEKKTENVSNGIQVSMEEPAHDNVAAQDIKVTSPAKISSEPAMHKENGKENASDNKTYTPPTVENSTAANGSLNDVTPAQGMTPPVESEEQFHFHIPNAFTPNNDSQNEYFLPIANATVKDYEMTIYDRYGFEIFKSRDIKFGWDGRLKNGNMAATAVYVYIIKLTDFNDEEHIKIHSFLLFK